MIGRGWPRPFALDRQRDVTGVSDTGTVAMGVIWPDQRAVMRWSGLRPPAGGDRVVQQVMLWDHADEICAVHGHGGATVLQVRDAVSACADLGMAVFGVVARAGSRRVVAYWGVSFHGGPAVTWRNDPDRATRIEQWPDGCASAWAELRGEVPRRVAACDEVCLAWIPGQVTDLVGWNPARRFSPARPAPAAAQTRKSP